MNNQLLNNFQDYLSKHRKLKETYRNEILLLKGKELSNCRRKSIVFYTYERVASRFVQRIMKSLIKEEGLTPIDLDGYFYHLGKIDTWTANGRFSKKNIYKSMGYYYGPFRSLNKSLVNISNYDVLLTLRDPRDVAVSLYYSYCYEKSKPWLASKKEQRKKARKRERFQNQTVDEFVIRVFRHWRGFKESYKYYCKTLIGKPNVLFLKYEDMVIDFDTWLNGIIEFFNFKPSHELIDKILKNANFEVKKEDISAQKRQVTPGDHKRKLKPETIDAVNSEFQDILDFLRYSEKSTAKITTRTGHSPGTYFPTVTVIVPAYNAQNTISGCINSLLNLDYPTEKLEIIVVNNAATDDTVQILNHYDSRLRILNEPKRGPAAARNRGILNARNEVVAFTDADCEVDRDWLRNLVIPLQDEHVGIVGGKILARRPCNSIEMFGEIIHDHNQAINKFKPPYVITMNWASKLSVIKDAGLFNEEFIRCEDVNLSHRIFQADYRFAYQPEAIVYHRNEKTFSGLFQEGYLHGFWAVKSHKTDKDFLKQFGYRRLNLHSYKEILSSLMNAIRRRGQNGAIFYFVFNLGKKVGRFLGSMRFFYLDL